MHPFQTAFQPLFCLCVYYLLLLYIQTISSVAAVHFFFHKNGNYPHLEFVRDNVPFCVIPLLPAALWGSTEFTSTMLVQHEGLVWSHFPLYLLSWSLYVWTAQFSSAHLASMYIVFLLQQKFMFLHLVSFCHIIWIKSQCLNSDVVYTFEG